MTGLGLLALSLSTFLAYNPSQPASAQDASGRQVKDFKHRKRLVVPASENVRRIDYQSLPGRDSLMLPTYVPKFPPAGAGGSQRYTNGSGQTPGSDPYASGLPQTNNNQDGMLGGELSATAESLSSTTTVHKPIGRTSRAGLTPPPPPIKSSLLPHSLTKELPNKTATAPHTTTTALSQQKVAQVKAQADALVKKGKPAEAQSLLSGYLKTNPNEKTLSTELSKISLQRAQGHAKAGNHEAATEQARLAITHGEHAPEIAQAAHTTLNSSLQKIGVKANAPEDRFDLGTKLMGQARYDEAVIEYSAAAKLKPTVEAYLGAGGAAMKGGHQLQAKKYFQDALELNPNSEPALRELGIARYHLKDYAGANADLTRALVINSSDKEAASTLLELWHHQVASRPTDANSHLGLARAYQVAGDLPAAQNEYKTVVKIHPQHPNLPAARQSFKLAYAKQEAGKAYDLAKTLESQGSLLSAYQKASEAVHLYPSEARYQSYCAQLAAKMQAAAQNPTAANALNQQSTLIPGSTPEAPPVLIPTAQAIGLAPAAVPGASVTPLGTASGNQQLSTDSQVNSMSNFLVSLRNFTMQQQNQIQAAEDSSIWKAGTSLKKPLLPGLGGEEAADTAIASAPSGIPVAAAATAATAPQSNSVADVLKNAALALANTNSSASVANTVAPASATAATSATVSPAASSVASAAPSTVAAAAQPNSYASWAMQAQETYKTSGIGSLASMTAGSAPALLTGKLKTINKQDLVTAAQKAASRFTTKPATAAKATAQPAAATSTSAQVAPAYNTAYSAVPMPSPVPIEAPPQSQAAYMQGGYQASPQLAAQQIASQQLATQPMASPQYDQISQMNSLQTNNQQLQAQLSQANSYIQQLQSRNAPAQSMPPQMMPGQQAIPSQQMMANQQVLASQQAMPGQQMGQPSGSVRLLLQGVKAAKDDVQLKVLLINETGQEIKLPSNLKASVRSSSQGERQGKASFSGKTVNPGASVTGTIKIAGSNLDPTADVLIPASSLAVVGMGDLHLTVPISQR
ncbi:MAG: hypothetical protein QG574_2891 [Cyanobacteriota bacterium erpe_2018_sw_21hr_WHONDRS-SW48-000092_B_bin.40]|nr:hypothetical protein [Cyanobacteriota bacterium erpe_2018_sw_21hr_WHONDRS-SW48-000092_B_bin.40]